MKSPYRRIFVKISGEAFSGESSSGMDKKACAHIVDSLRSIHELGVQIGVVVGGGNFFRGSLAAQFGLDRTLADQIGMLATVMNGIFLSEALRNANVPACVMGAEEYGASIERFSAQEGIKKLEEGCIVICVGGTGNPYFTTDTAAALRACELKAEMLFKATKVPGIYNKDPIKYPDAKKYETLSYKQALSEELQVMDAAAIALCKEANVPIFVFDLFKKESFLQAVCKLQGGSKVSS